MFCDKCNQHKHSCHFNLDPHYTSSFNVCVECADLAAEAQPLRFNPTPADVIGIFAIVGIIVILVGLARCIEP